MITTTHEEMKEHVRADRVHKTVHFEKTDRLSERFMKNFFLVIFNRYGLF